MAETINIKATRKIHTNLYNVTREQIHTLIHIHIIEVLTKNITFHGNEKVEG